MPPATKNELKSYHNAGLSPARAYEKFREDGGRQRKQDFLAAYRVITQKPRAAYNIGGAKRSDVVKPKVEKYEKKREKKRVQEGKKKPATKKPTGKKKRSESHGKKHKAGDHPFHPQENLDTLGGPGTSAKRSGTDISASYTAGSPDLKSLKKELQDHGIKFFQRNGHDALTLAKDGENGTVNLYGTMIYDPSRDKGGRAVGIARTLINKAMKAIGRQTTL